MLYLVEGVSLVVLPQVTVRVNPSKVNGAANDTGLRLQLEAVEAEADVHVFVAGAADREPALRSDVLGKPFDVAHHVTHVHQDLKKNNLIHFWKENCPCQVWARCPISTDSDLDQIV